ncbi:nucleotide-binding protein [Pseudomonas putida]|nr:TIR domain-containing protein [Pseudomonas putida]MDD2037501.1 nucleotide-binding protein [Pseudomonas putida]MDD2043116.1 nucleotide-binding protein [Pseudomonas putida]
MLVPRPDKCAVAALNCKPITIGASCSANVLLELGYFLGYLGRERVCALKRGQVEIPSDFAGIVWTSMNDGG